MVDLTILQTLDRVAEVARIARVQPSPLHDALQKIAAQQQSFAAAAQASFGPLQNAIARVNRALEELAPTVQRVAEVWSNLPEGGRKAQGLAAQKGWYLGMLDYSMQEMAHVVALGAADDADALDDWLAARTAANLSSIRDSALTAFPARAHILSQAFEAHERSHYAVSIPTLLAQADGMHHDLLEQHLFTKGHRKRLRQTLAARLGEDPGLPSTSLAFLFLRPLLEANALGESTGHRDYTTTPQDAPVGLSRHGVLHGVDLDYATERHALRAVGLIDFLTWVEDEIGGTSLPDSGRSTIETDS